MAMILQHNILNRRRIITGIGGASLALLAPSGVGAQGLGGLLRGGGGKNGENSLAALLGEATDSALDQLAKPGAFYGDEAIRIGLPIIGNPAKRGGAVLGTIMGAGSRLGLLDGVTRGINEAAGTAAGQAKPIFRDAIDDLSFTDAPGIIRESDGGTKFLRRSANDRLHAQLQPLIDGALVDAGIHREIDDLTRQHGFIREAGLNRDTVNRSVTDQALNGIFAYIGKEERSFRKNPLGSLLGS